MIDTKCPTCLGTGIVKRNPNTVFTPEQRAKARKLFRQGMSFRKIGKELGIKHPQSVKSMIQAKI